MTNLSGGKHQVLKRNPILLPALAVILAIIAVGSITGQTQGGLIGAYRTILSAGSAVAQRQTVNFIGVGVGCVDNSGADRTDCTVAGRGIVLTDPASSWTSFNTAQMGTVPTYASSRWIFTSKDNNAGVNEQGIAKVVPSTPYSKYFRIWPMVGKTFSLVSVGWADGTVGTPGKISLCGAQAGGNGGSGVIAINLASTTGGVTSTITTSAPFPSGNNVVGIAPSAPVWFRLSDTGSVQTCEISYDYAGVPSSGNWLTVWTRSSNTFLTPTQLVVTVDNDNSGSNSQPSVVFDSYGDS